MRQTILVLVFCASVFALPLRQITDSSAKEPNHSKEQELIALDRKWGDAMENADEKGLSVIVADDYIGIGSKGEITNKKDTVAQLRNLPSNLKFDLDEYIVRFVASDVALIVHRASFKGTEKEKEIFEAHRSIHVFVRRNGRWQVLASGQTPIPSAE